MIIMNTDPPYNHLLVMYAMAFERGPNVTSLCSVCDRGFPTGNKGNSGLGFSNGVALAR